MRGYTDAATGTMIEDGRGGGAFSEATLRPRVVVADASMLALADEIHAEAADLCFIAASVAFPVHHRRRRSWAERDAAAAESARGRGGWSARRRGTDARRRAGSTAGRTRGSRSASGSPNQRCQMRQKFRLPNAEHASPVSGSARVASLGWYGV